MSIISNEHLHGSPFPQQPEQEPLPEVVCFGEYEARSGRYESGELYWDICRKGSRLSYHGAIDGDVTKATLRAVLYAVESAYRWGHNEARREIRQVLGIRD